MIDFKNILGIIAVILALFASIPYIWDIYKSKTKPHSITWFIWGAMAAIVFTAQILKGGGPGAWVMAAFAVIDLFIFILALKYGEKNIVLFDWFCLVIAIFSLLLWFITKDPTISIVIITIIDISGGLPTIRKVFYKPFDETLVTYILYFCTWIFSILALENYNLVTVLDPLALLLSNALIVTLILIRRRVKMLN